MAWPTGNLSLANVDADSDSISSARADIYSAFVKVNELTNTSPATFLPAYTGNIAANYITTTSGIFWPNGSAYATGNITGNGGGTYGNTEVAAYFNTVPGANIGTTIFPGGGGIPYRTFNQLTGNVVDAFSLTTYGTQFATGEHKFNSSFLLLEGNPVNDVGSMITEVPATFNFYSEFNGNTEARAGRSAHNGIGVQFNTNVAFSNQNNSRITFAANIESTQPIVTTGNVYANKFLGDGSLLTNVASTYGNTQVAAYIGIDPTFTGYLTFANANAASQSLEINGLRSNITAANASIQVVSANIGSYQTYANARVQTLEANVGSYQNYANATFATSTTFTGHYLLVAGGGGGGWRQNAGGGGGGGGLLAGSFSITPGTSYTITIGAGGTASTGDSVRGGIGGNTSAFNLTAIGGGGGGSGFTSSTTGGNGGSGGGGMGIDGGTTTAGGSGTSGQGFAGAAGAVHYGRGRGGGGGGAGAAASVSTASVASAGGIGANSNITGTLVTYAGGGGGSRDSVGNATVQGAGGIGGLGGGGNGGGYSTGGSYTNPSTAGTVNSGGGGGGGCYADFTGGINYYHDAKAGGSGFAVLNVPSSKYSGNANVTGTYTYSENNGNVIIAWTTSGSYLS